jgi:WxL domain surface cell wall-binding
MDLRFVRTRLGVGIATGAVLMATIATPALGVDTVTQNITGSGLTASVANLNLADTGYQNGAHAVTGTMVLTADDSTGTGAGWNVTVMSSAFVWVGLASGGQDIPASAFALTSASAPTMISGQPVGVAAATGPQVPPVSPFGSLATARKVLSATAAYGSGAYTQDLGVTLTIPAMSRVGSYTGTLTTTITSAP